MKLSILSHTIKVKEDDAKGWETGSHGQYTDNDNIVRINKSSTKQVKDLTLIHELIHVVESLTGQAMTEEQVQSQALGWYSIIRENPEFIASLYLD